MYKIQMVWLLFQEIKMTFILELDKNRNRTGGATQDGQKIKST